VEGLGLEERRGKKLRRESIRVERVRREGRVIL